MSSDRWHAYHILTSYLILALWVYVKKCVTKSYDLPKLHSIFILLPTMPIFKKTLGQFENLVLVIMSIRENSFLISRTPFCLKQVALSPLGTVPIFLRIQVLLFFHDFIVISGKKTYNRLTRCY